MECVSSLKNESIDAEVELTYDAFAVTGDLLVPVALALPLLPDLFLLHFLDLVGTAFLVCSFKSVMCHSMDN